MVTSKGFRVTAFNSHFCHLVTGCPYLGTYLLCALVSLSEIRAPTSQSYCESAYVRILAQCPALSTEEMLIKCLLLLTWFHVLILKPETHSYLKSFGHFTM